MCPRPEQPSLGVPDQPARPADRNDHRSVRRVSSAVFGRPAGTGHLLCGLGIARGTPAGWSPMAPGAAFTIGRRPGQSAVLQLAGTKPVGQDYNWLCSAVLPEHRSLLVGSRWSGGATGVRLWSSGSERNTSNPYAQAFACAETPIIGHMRGHGAAFSLVALPLPRRQSSLRLIPIALAPRLWEHNCSKQGSG